MSSRSKKLAAMYGLMAFAAASGDMHVHDGTDNSDAADIDIQPKPPKGAKEYFFNSSGEFSTESMLKEDVEFKCYAINNKNAIRKFKKFNKRSTG